MEEMTEKQSEEMRSDVRKLTLYEVLSIIEHSETENLTTEGFQKLMSEKIRTLLEK